MAPAARHWRKTRLLRANRAGLRIQSGGMRTRARKDGDEYILNGEKMWITSGSIADIAVIWAKVENEDGNRIRGFIVETDRPASAPRSSRQVVAARLGDLRPFLAGCPHPAANLLPGTSGLRSPAHVSEPGALRHQLGRASARPCPATTARCNIPRSASSSAISPSPAIN